MCVCVTRRISVWPVCCSEARSVRGLRDSVGVVHVRAFTENVTAVCVRLLCPWLAW